MLCPPGSASSVARRFGAAGASVVKRIGDWYKGGIATEMHLYAHGGHAFGPFRAEALEFQPRVSGPLIPIDAADQVEQCRFAAAGFPHQPHRLALGDGQAELFDLVE